MGTSLCAFFHIILLPALTIQWLQLRRGSIGKVLRQTHASMTLLQFMRLMALASILTLFSLGFGFYQLYVFVAVHKVTPWVSWEFVHSKFFHVGQVPSAFMSAADQSAIWAFWSVQPAAALVFFLLFGPTAQALSDIASGWRSLKQRLGLARSLGSDGRPKGAQTINSFAS